jgi:hypothetical protein
MGERVPWFAAPPEPYEPHTWTSEVCATCHGEGVVTVGGYSVNPFSGVLVSDPQEAHDELCPECAA